MLPRYAFVAACPDCVEHVVVEPRFAVPTKNEMGTLLPTAEKAAVAVEKTAAAVTTGCWPVVTTVTDVSDVGAAREAPKTKAVSDAPFRRGRAFSPVASAAPNTHIFEHAADKEIANAFAVVGHA